MIALSGSHFRLDKSPTSTLSEAALCSSQQLNSQYARNAACPWVEVMPSAEIKRQHHWSPMKCCALFVRIRCFPNRKSTTPFEHSNVRVQFFGRLRLGTRQRLRFSYLRFRTRAWSLSLQASGRTSATNPSVINLLKARSFSKRLRPCRSAAVRNGTFEDSSSSSSCRWRRPSPLGMTPHRH